tara:strand:- start:60 stop:551 length:492 start_codon:yes stop_codon:yes gene_type:complete
MERELYGRKFKYDEGKLWVWRERWGKRKLKNPYWYELKGKINNKTGYKSLHINYRYFYYHRLVYLIHNPDWDIDDSSQANSIDHIDRNKLNNCIENLRVVTHAENQWNRNAKGYTLHKGGKYQGKIVVDGKAKYLGLFNTKDEAHQSYLNEKAIHHIFPANPE